MVADFEGQIVVEPEPQIFDVAHEVGGDKDVDWRFGIGEGDEGFLEDDRGRWSVGWRDDAASMIRFSWGVKVRRSGSAACAAGGPGGRGGSPLGYGVWIGMGRRNEAKRFVAQRRRLLSGRTLPHSMARDERGRYTFPLPARTQTAPNQFSIGMPTSSRPAWTDIVAMSVCHVQKAW